MPFPSLSPFLGWRVGADKNNFFVFYFKVALATNLCSKMAFLDSLCTRDIFPRKCSGFLSGLRKSIFHKIHKAKGYKIGHFLEEIFFSDFASNGLPNCWGDKI